MVYKRGNEMEELIQSIYDSPEDWEIGQHTFSHKHCGFKLWIANGPSNCKPYESGMNINRSQKKRIWKAYTVWCTDAPLIFVR